MNDIIKALECCLTEDRTKSLLEICAPCPYFHEGNCAVLLKKNALDLINRQKAEIERLQHIRAKLSKENDRLYIALEENQKVTESWKDIAHRETGYVKIARIEAIKEFAEKLKKRLKRRTEYDEGGWDVALYTVTEEDVDALVKERTEGEDGNV